MTNKLYVGNLNYRTTEEQLKEVFEKYGEVSSVKVIEGRGFGFVEMSTSESAQEAINSLNGYELDGRKIIVDKARPPRKDKRKFRKF
jgi:RNA recognition motif-containing protein